MDYRKLTKIVDGSVNRYKFIDAERYYYEEFLDYLSECDESERFLTYSCDDDLKINSVDASDLMSVYCQDGKWLSYDDYVGEVRPVDDWTLGKYDTVYVWEDTYNA